MRKPTKRIFSSLLVLVMLLGVLTVSASAARDTIDSVTIEVDRPVVGESLTNCVPSADQCEPITEFSWTAYSPRGGEVALGTGAGHTVAANNMYFLTLTLEPMEGFYTFSESAEVNSSNGSVAVTSQTTGKIVCTVLLTPMTRATEVAVSVAQPAVGATPGTPTAAGGHTVSDVSWWRSSTSDIVTGVQLGADDVFTKSYNYWMEATVTAGTNSLFGESTAVTVNGQDVIILEKDLEANTITFRYHVGSEELLTVAGNIYVADGSGGSWHLTHGATQTNGSGYTASYVNGILTLTNTGDSTVGGTYQVPNQTWYTGIYADGDLTVHFNGDFHFDLSGTPEDASYVYGIYTVGDLTLVNVSDADCTVSFSPADGVLATHGSNGIYCEIGSLTVENEGGGDFTLNADAVGVRPVDGAVEANFTNNGIYARSITIGDDCTVNATAADVALSAEGITTSRGIYAYYDLTIGKNAVVTAAGGSINPSRSATTLSIGFSQLCYGVEVREDITVNGGTLTATGGNINYGALDGGGNATYGNQNSYGIYAADITLSGGAITAKAGICRSSALVTGSLSEGIYCSNLTVSSGTLTAAADDAWWESTGLCVRNNLTQTGGTIIGTGDLAVCAGSTTGTGSRGIFVANTLTASGGSLTGTGGTMGGNPFPSVGLQTATIDLSGTAEVAGIGGLTTKGTIETPLAGSSSFANYPGDSIGVWAFSNLKVDDDAVLTATGGTVKGDRTSSAAKAMSIGLGFRLADGFTISGSGTVVATGGETHYGSKGYSLCDSSCGIYGDVPSLTISGTTVTATGGSVSTKTVSGNGTTMGGVSYGLHLPAGSLTLQSGAKLTATGGENPNYSTLSTQPSKHNDSYGAYIKGDITVTDSVFTATGSISHRTVGLFHGGAVTLSGLDSRLTASANEYRTDGYASDGKYSRGIRNGDTNESWAGGAYTVNGGIMLLRGQTGALSYSSSNTLTAATIQKSFNWDGSAPSSERSPASFTSLASYKYVKADGSSVAVTIKDWTYGDAASTPTYTAYEGEPTILWTGTTRAGASYSSENAPTEAGDYTVTVTYPGGQTGSADFAVKPRSITTCSWNGKGQLTYNGKEQTQSVTIKYDGKELVEGTDYTLSDNKQTDAGSYTLTITGIGNFEGTRTGNFTIKSKTPTVEDFNIPVIEEYAYTGEPVTLELPTLKEGYTGGGTVTLSYSTGTTQPTDVGAYTVYFAMTEGDNFSASGDLLYGTLVIRPAGFAVIVDIADWTYGSAAKTPTFTEYDGDPTFLYTGTTRAGAPYSSNTAPTDAGSYTVTVTYPAGQTGSADFTVKPVSINSCNVTLDDVVLTYNGMPQTKGVTVSCLGTALAEGTDYTVTGNTQTNAGTYTITVTGTGNVEGTKTNTFTINSKTPTAEDFNIPVIGEYAYTGELVELPLPELKEPMTGIGEIKLNYYCDSGGTLIPAEPRDVNEYTVTFHVQPGDNFYAGYGFEYGTLVIRPAGFAVVVDIEDWTYGEEASTLTYTDYDGEPKILWTGTTRAGVTYSSETAPPTEAGSYTVTVTYDESGRTGSTAFEVKPVSISDCDVKLDTTTLTYNGLEQTKVVTVSCYGTALVEGRDYIVTGNKQTDAGSHTITVTGINNFEGTETKSFYIYRKALEREDFDIPEIEEHAYTGNPVELTPPTLKAPYTGGGEITLRYNGNTTPPTEVGEYEVYFDMTEGRNVYIDRWLEYGTLVIGPPAPVSNIGILDLEAPLAGKDPDRAAVSASPNFYSVNPVIWLDEDGHSVSSFDEGVAYTAKITVIGYTYSNSGDRCSFADSVTATLNGNPVTGEGCSVTKNADGTVIILYKFPATEAPSTAIRGTVTVTGTSAAASVTVEDFSGTKATLIVAQYSGGQMKAVQTVSVTADRTFAPTNPFTHADGCTYKAFLINAENSVPLCAAADLPTV